jgi:uncharacterized protein YjiK
MVSSWRRVGVAALALLPACKSSPAPAESWAPCAPGGPKPVELVLERALPVAAEAHFQPSGLYLSRGHLLTVSDKHDEAVFELDLQSEVAVARPFLTFEPPAGKALDLEGLTGNDDGSLLLASESQLRLLVVSPSGRAQWSAPSLEEAGRKAGLFQKSNAGLEGVARIGNQLVLAAEREPRGLLEADEKGGNVVAYRMPAAPCTARSKRSDDWSDLTVSDGELFALERNTHHIVRLARVDGRYRHVGYWSYAQTENDPRYRYEDRTFGLAEGLALDDQHVYVVLDNNEQTREAARSDRRPLLFVFRRPR